MGIDIDDFDEAGVIGNSVTSATVHLTSTGDFFMPAMISLITDEWQPVSTSPPVVSGTAMDAQTLSTTNGTWNASATPTFTYQWQRCDAAGSNCVNIAGATSSTYTQVPADVGKTLRSVVTATNVAGSSSQSSAVTSVVQPAPPANTVLPTVTGTARDGQTLTVASDGTWTGTPTISYTYQWRRCDSAGRELREHRRRHGHDLHAHPG